MEVKSIIFTVVLIVSLGVFGLSFRRMVAFISIGKPDNRLDKPWQRDSKR